MGDHAAAWEESKHARELDPNLFTARTLLAFDRAATGHLDEARMILGEPITVTTFAGMSAYGFQVVGDTARAAEIRRDLAARPDTTYAIHTARAYGYLSLGDTSRALSEIEAGLDHGELVPQHILFVDRVLDSVRHSARFAAIGRRVGLDLRTFTRPIRGTPAR